MTLRIIKFAEPMFDDGKSNFPKIGKHYAIDVKSYLQYKLDEITTSHSKGSRTIKNIAEDAKILLITDDKKSITHLVTNMSDEDLILSIL